MVLHRVHHQILRSHHLFEPLNEEQMEELLNASQLLNLDKGDNLFHQGEPAHNFYFVISGAVKVYRLTPDGQEKVFEVIGNRQTFAEAMMLMDTPNYVASAQAVCPSQVYRFSNAAYMRLLEANQRLTFALLGKLCVRLHQRINEIETLSLKNATHRVVRYLLTQLARVKDDSNSFELPMAKQLVAGHLSIQPETFSRIIRRLIDEGIITQEGRQIAILDRQRLEQFDLGVRQFDENDRDAMLRLRQRLRDAGAQRVAIERGRGREILHGDGDVVEASDHGAPLLVPADPKPRSRAHAPAASCPTPR